MRTVTFKDITDEEPGKNDWCIPEGIASDIRRLSGNADFFDSVSREISLYEVIRAREKIQMGLPDRKTHADDMIKAVKTMIRKFSIIEKYDPHNPKLHNELNVMNQYWISYREKLDSTTGRPTKQNAIRIVLENLLPVFRSHELEHKLSGFMSLAVLQIPSDKKPPSKTLIKNILQELKAS